MRHRWRHHKEISKQPSVTLAHIMLCQSTLFHSVSLDWLANVFLPCCLGCAALQVWRRGLLSTQSLSHWVVVPRSHNIETHNYTHSVHSSKVSFATMYWIRLHANACTLLINASTLPAVMPFWQMTLTLTFHYFCTLSQPETNKWS